MPNYRRRIQSGGTFFLTLVTQNRAPIFADAWARDLLRQSIANCQQHHAFSLDAIVLLPDHLHLLMTLPSGQINYICYNPVKHKLVKCPHEWPHSSFHRLVSAGRYSNEWCCQCGGATIEEPPEFAAIAEAAGE